MIPEFTPVFDSLAVELGSNVAMVYGLIWRYCQDTGICEMDQDTLSRHLGVNRATFRRHIKTLVAAGYIIEEWYGPYSLVVYRITKKLEELNRKLAYLQIRQRRRYK